MRCGYSDAN